MESVIAKYWHLTHITSHYVGLIVYYAHLKLELLSVSRTGMLKHNLSHV